VATVADGVDRYSEEGEFFVERRKADVLRKVDAPRSVVAEHVTEQFRITVEEILIHVGVVEELLFDGPQQSVWVLELLTYLLTYLLTHWCTYIFINIFVLFDGPQQSVRVLFDRLLPRLKSSSADVDP